MKERSISRMEVRMAIKLPDKFVRQDDRNLAIKIRGNSQILIVCYRELADAVKVITVISSSKIDKYL